MRRNTRANSRKQRRPARKGRSPGLISFRTLCAAAATVSSLGLESPAGAQAPPEHPVFRFQYSYYEDWQQGNEDRITVRAPMAWLKTGIAENTELEAGFVLDTISGASPLYHDALSGASGIGIEDERVAGDLTLRQYFESFSIGVGVNSSNEDDYDSLGGALTGSIWTDDKNTVVDFGLSANTDDVTSENNPELSEDRRAWGTFVGVTQILDKDSLIQTNFSFAHDGGYLDDPYKPEDLRPENRDMFAWLNRYVRYMAWAKASLHADYRYYRDSWSIDSHTLELQWFQPLGASESWILRPRLRYYTQSKAEFYHDFFPPNNPGLELYTADQRLSGFGDLTTGLKLIKEFEGGFGMSAAADFVYTSSGLKSFSGGSPGIEDLYTLFFSFGISKSF